MRSCERENKWLDETPYLVDTNVIPRGGARRRKSMEPKALVNLNEKLIPWSGTSRQSCVGGDLPEQIYQNFETPMTSKSYRRDSVQWIHSSSTCDTKVHGVESILSPLPSTPRPEDIATYEDGISDETLMDSEPSFLHKQQLVQKTAPPIKRHLDFKMDECENELSAENTKNNSDKIKEQNLMIRLMAARRKSLQWAPKVGSPLAKVL